MGLQVVTGYIPIQGHPRSAEEYGTLGENLFKPLAQNWQVKRYLETVGETWLWKYVGHKKGITHSAGDYPEKNSLAYHCVNHQKFGWLLKAAIEDPTPDVFVWLDYGVGHVHGVTPEVVDEFLKKVESDPKFAIPGCWDESAMISDFFPCWRFCGGVLVVPRHHVHTLYKAAKKTALGHVDKTHNVTWEVNTLAAAERAGLLKKLNWYQADHDKTMFTGYPS